MTLPCPNSPGPGLAYERALHRSTRTCELDLAELIFKNATVRPLDRGGLGTLEQMISESDSIGNVVAAVYWFVYLRKRSSL